MPIELPTQVLQGLGLAPPPVVQPPPVIPPFDSALEGAPQLGAVPVPPLDPPVVESPDLGESRDPVPPAPILPSLAPAPAPAPEPNRDFPVPVSAFGAGQQPAAPTPQQPQRPAAPMTPEAQLQRAQQKQSQADVDAANAIAAKRDADVGLARDNLAANRAFDAQTEAIEKQRKAFAEESEKTRAQKQAYVASTMADVDNYKVDQNKYLNQMGLGRKAGWGIAMIMSGVGDALQRKQGPNPVVQMLQQTMHDAVVAQIDERDQLKAKNARAQHELDKYDSWSKDRMAQIALLDAQNEKRLANMLRTAAAKAAEPMAQAAALDAVAKLEKSSAENAQKSAEFASTNDIAKRQLQVSQGNLALSQRRFEHDVNQDAARLQLDRDKVDVEAAKLMQQGKTDQAKLVRERAVGGEYKEVPVDPKDVKPGDKTYVRDGKTFRIESGLMANRDGSTWIPGGTDPVVTEFQKQHQAGLKALAAIDSLRQLGPEWMSNTVNSDKLQQFRTEVANGVLAMVQYGGMGVPQQHDIEQAMKAGGFGEPGQFKDTKAALDRARAIVLRNMNTSLEQRGYDRPWSGPPDPTKQPDAKPSRIRELETKLKREPETQPERARAAGYAAALKDTKGDIAAAHVAGEAAAQAARDGRPDPGQIRGVEELKQIALGGGPDAQGAVDSLRNIVTERSAAAATGVPRVGSIEWARSLGRPPSIDAIQAAAEAALSEIRTASQPTPTTSSAGVRNEGYNPIDLINRFHRTPEPTLSPRTRSASLP